MTTAAAWPTPAGDPGGPDEAQPVGEQCPEYPAAVHGKHREEVEQEHVHVHRHEADDERLVVDDGVVQGGSESQQIGQDKQRTGDDQAHRRPGERDQQLLPRLLREALETSHPADGEQNDVGRSDPEAAGHQNVPELVKHDATEQREEK